MALDFEKLPTILFNPPQRSAIDLLRRMLLLRWSSGPYLNAITGNYGLKRPPLGFHDDELFRSVAAAVMATPKGHLNSIWKILEIFLGPYNNLVFKLENDAKIGDTYLTISRDISFATYSSWNSTPFVKGEIIKNNSGVQTKFRYLDTQEQKIYFDPLIRGSFKTGETLTGQTSNATVTLSSDNTLLVTESNTSQFQRMPLLASAVLNKDQSGLEENIELTLPDYFQHKIRLRNPLTKNHSAGDILWIQGGCWEVYETQARKIFIKIKCNNKLVEDLRGHTYFHRNAWVYAHLREALNPGDSVIKLDESVVQGYPTASIFDPVKLILDPEEEYGKLLEVEAYNHNESTREWFLIPTIPPNYRFIAGTKVKWLQTNIVSAGLTQAASIGDTQIKAICRYTKEDVYGVWSILDNELIYITDTTYQRRKLTSDITPQSTFINIDYPFDNIKEGTVSLTVRVWDTTGLLGTLNISNIFWYVNNDKNHLYPQLGLLNAPTFSTDIKNKPAYIELVDNSTGEVTLTLAKPLTKAHSIGDTLTQVLGTKNLIVSEDDYVPLAGWPNATNPTGQWPGSYIYKPNYRGPSRLKTDTNSTIIARGEVAQDANDCRIYMCNQQLVEKVDPATAPSTLGIITVPLSNNVSKSYKTIDIKIDDASYLPTTQQINAWRNSKTNPNPRYPIQLRIGTEGGWNSKEPIYYWGKGTAANGTENIIYVSGLQRVHHAGTRVLTYHTELPITAEPNVIGNSNGLPTNQSGYLLLDFSRETQEEIYYDRITKVHDTRGELIFDKGWTPQYSHNPFAPSNINTNVIVGCPIVRTGQSFKDSYPRLDGYSFSSFINGNILLLRLAYIIELVRAAGIQVEFFDEKDRKLLLPTLSIFKLNR